MEHQEAAKNLTQKPATTPKKRLDIASMRAKDREPVKGIFRFYESPGGCMEFSYKCYKGDQIERFNLQDGEVCTIPLGVAKHLNKNGWYPVHAYRVEDNGKASMHIGKKVRRFGFQSLEFVDIEDLSPVGSGIEIVTMI